MPAVWQAAPTPTRFELAACYAADAPAKFGTVASPITFGFVCHETILVRVSIIRTLFLVAATRQPRGRLGPVTKCRRQNAPRNTFRKPLLANESYK